MALGLNTSAGAVMPKDLSNAVVSVKGRWTEATLSGNITLDATYSSNVRLDPGGSNRDVTLEAVGVSSGMERNIVNIADNAENLVVKNAGGSTIATLNQNERGVFYCDGSAWYLCYIATIALS